MISHFHNSSLDSAMLQFKLTNIPRSVSGNSPLLCSVSVVNCFETMKRRVVNSSFRYTPLSHSQPTIMRMRSHYWRLRQDNKMSSMVFNVASLLFRSGGVARVRKCQDWEMIGIYFKPMSVISRAGPS